MEKTWIVVADEAVARVLHWDPEAAALREIETMTDAAAHARGTQLRRDAHGRRKGGGTRAGGTVTASSGKDEEHQEAQGFARRVAQWLYKAHADRRFDSLKIAAAPRFLGLMRNELDANVKRSVRQELSLDLTHLDERALAQRLMQGGHADDERPAAESAAPIESTPTNAVDPETARIYARLRKGEARELVREDNVRSLIEMAERDGHPVLAQELREWRASCADSQDKKES